VSASPGRLRIAVSGETPAGDPLDPDVAAALENTAATLKALGHDVRAENLGIDYRALYRAQGMVSAANFAASMQRWIALKGREPGDEIEGLARRLFEAGKAMSGGEALWAVQELRLRTREILQRFENWDVLLTPVMNTPPPRVDFLDTLTPDLKEFDRRQRVSFGFTPPFNMTGQPSLSLPLAQSRGNLPIGMMFTARYGDEATLLRLAGQLEKEMPWKDRRPVVWD
ncbi:MAG TPA: amidase family protein, partial [Terricaulis sp.]|nr:amidase family protein [Terricaulis sp.]